MLAIRLPVSVVNGAALMVAAFWLLWSLVARPIDVITVPDHGPIQFTRLRVETPVETKEQPRPVPPQPVVTPELPTIVVPTDIGPAVITPMVVEPLLPRTSGAVGLDGDVTPLFRAEPVYPQTAITREIEGWVRVRFTITETGSVTDPIVVSAEPANIFDRAALSAIARWRYNPKVEGGVAVERVGVEAVIDFQLTEEE